MSSSAPHAGASGARGVLARSSTAVLAACLVIGSTSCSGGSSGEAAGPTAGADLTAAPSTAAPTSTSAPPSPNSAPSVSRVPGPDAQPRVTGTVATGLDAPWGLAFLPDGDALVSERDRGRIVRVSRSGRITAVGNVAGVDPGGEGGLLGLALSPRFAQDRLLYAYFTAATDNRLVRMRYETNGQLGAPQVILDGLAKATIHNGGRIAFGPDGYLYVGTGDAAFPARAQDRSSLNGKILRMTSNGRPAPGNPFGSPVFSLGHRNVQGLAWDSGGRLWASEFGQNRYDELNLITAGRNYGWPEVEGPGGSGGFVAPQAWWSTAVASPSGVEVAGGAAYLAALRGARLWQVPIVGGRAGQPRAFFVGTYGRLRTVELAPDGSLWLMTSNTDGRGSPRTGDDRILRVALE